MSYYYGPSIIKDGLALCLDAANPKSYIGSGTTWYDLSGNGNNGTLTNGPTFSGANKGSIVFDGTDDSVIIPNSTSVSITGDMTISAWIKLIDTSWYRSIASKTNINNPAPYDFYIKPGGIPSFFRGNGSSNASLDATSALSTGIWYNISVTMIGTAAVHYLNTTVNGTGVISTTITNNASSGLYIGNRADGLTRMFGNMSNVYIYNRGLSSSEIVQNYNATKGRFGLK